ncbi:MAG: signal peptide peptidase SppA [Methanocellales archaeon]|nr:signal peptide peptidase SppA [Methanocellales archaeon]MDD4898754.1 signal peptide peptidase SppA [Methanocellales archaeon]MDD5447503.1 signal peptide peptidase SppA [Methanocellales archaeon]
MEKDSRNIKVKHLVVAFILGVALVWVLLVATETIRDMGIVKEEIAVIYVQGEMVTGNVPNEIGYATSESICKNIRDATDELSVKAIVLRVNSPGGTPAAAQEIVTEIKNAQEKGKPVVISMGEIATSGAYYISAPAERIVANPDTMTGSIGVIWIFTNMSGYYSEEGIDFEVVKSGEFKDMGADWRGLTEEEKEYADQVIMDSYDRFVKEVAQGRNMPTNEVKKLADGRIYLGASAKDLGLIDELGNLHDAIDAAAKLGGIKGTPQVKYMKDPSLSNLWFDVGGEYDAQHYLRYLEENRYGKLLT